MVTAKNKKKLSPRERSLRIFQRCRQGRRPTKPERRLLIDLYWSGQLPRDTNYSLYQWVEDGFPEVM